MAAHYSDCTEEYKAYLDCNPVAKAYNYRACLNPIGVRQKAYSFSLANAITTWENTGSGVTFKRSEESERYKGWPSGNSGDYESGGPVIRTGWDAGDWYSRHRVSTFFDPDDPGEDESPEQEGDDCNYVNYDDATDDNDDGNGSENWRYYTRHYPEEGDGDGDGADNWLYVDSDCEALGEGFCNGYEDGCGGEWEDSYYWTGGGEDPGGDIGVLGDADGIGDDLSEWLDANFSRYQPYSDGNNSDL